MAKNKIAVRPEDGETMRVALYLAGLVFALSGCLLATVVLTAAQIAARRKAMKAKGAEAFKPQRDRQVSEALQAYALFATSAANGAVRDIAQVVARKRGR